MYKCTNKKIKIRGNKIFLILRFKNIYYIYLLFLQIRLKTRAAIRAAYPTHNTITVMTSVAVSMVEFLIEKPLEGGEVRLPTVRVIIIIKINILKIIIILMLIIIIIIIIKIITIIITKTIIIIKIIIIIIITITIIITR